MSDLEGYRAEGVPSRLVAIDVRSLPGLVGCVCCYAWLFAVLGIAPLFALGQNDAWLTEYGRVAFLLGVCVSLLVVWWFSDFFQTHATLQCLASALLSFLGIAFLFVGQASEECAMLCLSPLSSGMGFGLLYVLCGEFICLRFSEYLKSFICGIIACSAVLCGFFVAFLGEEAYGAFRALPILAAFCYAISSFLMRTEKRSKASGRDSDSRSRIVVRSYLATSTSNMAAGFSLGTFLCVSNGRLALCLLAIAVAAVCFVLLADSLNNYRANETFAMKAFLPISAVVALSIFFVPDFVVLVLCVVLLCFSLIPVTNCISAACKHAVMFDLSAVRVFSLGRIAAYAGLTVGIVLAFSGFSDAAQNATGGLSVMVSVIVFTMLAIFSKSFVLLEDNYPDERLFRTIVRETERFGASSSSSLRIFEDETVALAEGGESPSTDFREMAGDGDVSEERRNPLYVKCGIVADRYGLSDRQREILPLLAKGKCNDYVAKKQFISTHTVKCHVYNIYQKLGVHSRPELMDLVEGVEIAAPDERGMEK